MKLFENTITISRQSMEKINNYLKATEPDDFQNENDTISYTAAFPDGCQIDVQCCGCQDECSWTQAVLFNEHGGELCCSEPGDEFEGDWELEYDDTKYIVHVVPETA